MAISMINTLRTEIYLAGKLWAPNFEQVRYAANRPNLQKPLPLHYKRKRMLTVCEPRYPSILYPCEKVDKFPWRHMMKPKSEEANPYAEFLARRMRENFDKYPLIAIFHRNSYTQHDMLKFRGHLHDAKFDMTINQWINEKVAKRALEGTKWSPALHLLVSKTAIGYCNSTNIEKLNKILKKMPSFLLIGVITQNKLMNRADAEAFSKIPNIDAVRAQLCHTLSLAAVSLHRTLEINQQSLSHSLNTYATSSTITPSGEPDKGLPDEKNIKQTDV